ncbi:hypothetical protein ACFX13_036032 [Malus domestica]
MGTSSLKAEGRSLLQHQNKAKSSDLFNVKSFGARADGRTDDSNAFTAAWKEACQSTGRFHLIIPKGTYTIGPLRFSGPCGYLKATTDLCKYGSGGRA